MDELVNEGAVFGVETSRRGRVNDVESEEIYAFV